MIKHGSLSRMWYLYSLLCSLSSSPTSFTSQPLSALPLQASTLCSPLPLLLSFSSSSYLFPPPSSIFALLFLSYSPSPPLFFLLLFPPPVVLLFLSYSPSPPHFFLLLLPSISSSSTLFPPPPLNFLLLLLKLGRASWRESELLRVKI